MRWKLNILEIDNLSFSYGMAKVLKDLNLKLKEKEVAVITGENGSGKSTLLKIMLKELNGYSGSVKIFEEDLKNIKDFKDVGYVPQVERSNGISFPVTVKELVSLNFYREFGFIKKPSKKLMEMTRKKLEALDILQYENTPFNELSGGLKQRVMIARALVKDPKLLLLDEPTSGVDMENKVHFMEMIGKLNKEKGITILMVSHECEFIKNHLNLDRILDMREGALIDVGI